MRSFIFMSCSDGIAGDTPEAAFIKNKTISMPENAPDYYIESGASVDKDDRVLVLCKAPADEALQTENLAEFLALSPSSMAMYHSSCTACDMGGGYFNLLMKFKSTKPLEVTDKVVSSCSGVLSSKMHGLSLDSYKAVFLEIPSQDAKEEPKTESAPEQMSVLQEKTEEPASITYSDTAIDTPDVKPNKFEALTAAYAAALATKGFVILGGGTGTGKTALAANFAAAALGGAPQVTEYESTILDPVRGTKVSKINKCRNPLLLAVRPDWGTSALMGAPVDTANEAAKTPFELLLQSPQSEAGKFVILDEMSLARAEYYLCDLLSAMDAPYPEDCAIPKNLYITGTANMDETSFAFTPKVLDRAFYFALSAQNVDLNQNGTAVGKIAQKFAHLTKGGVKPARQVIEEAPSKAEYFAKIKAMIEDFNAGNTKIALGYRVYAEICAFVHYYCELTSGGEAFYEALDWAVLTKILPKFHGSRDKLENAHLCLAGAIKKILPAQGAAHNPITALLKNNGAQEDENIALNQLMSKTAARLSEISWELKDTGYALFC